MGDRKLLMALWLSVFSSTCMGVSVHQWTDENGNVVFGDAPVQGGTKKLKVYSGPSGINVCNDECRKNAQSIQIRERIPYYRTDPVCKFYFFTIGDQIGKQLAQAAKEECAENKATQEFAPNFVPKQDALAEWQQHFEIEKAKRSRR